MIEKNISIETCNDPAHPHHCGCCHPKRICWSAILIGAVVGLGLGFLLNLFGLAIGLSAFTMSNEGSMVVAIGGLIGILVGIMVSMGLAGYAAGYLGRLYCPKRNLGILYGFATWSIALMLGAIATGHMNHYVNAYSNTISSAVIIAPENPTAQPAAPSATIATPSGDKVNVPAAHVAWAAFTVFGLFLLGAISCCVGACCGMSCRKEEPHL